MISNVWIINRNNGTCLIHKSYSQLNKIDSNLFSGLLTAIVNFSEEITGGEFIKSVTMASTKFFYNVSKDFIIAISIKEHIDEENAKEILGVILNSFINLGYADTALLNPDITFLLPFEAEIDKIIQEITNELTINQSVGEILKEPFQQVQITEDPETTLKKEKIEEVIGNAEWALSMANYKDAKIYFHVAVELFKELKEFEMAQWCQEMIELTKTVELQEVKTDSNLELISEEEALKIISAQNIETTRESPVINQPNEVINVDNKSNDLTSKEEALQISPEGITEAGVESLASNQKIEGIKDDNKIDNSRSEEEPFLISSAQNTEINEESPIINKYTEVTGNVNNQEIEFKPENYDKYSIEGKPENLTKVSANNILKSKQISQKIPYLLKNLDNKLKFSLNDSLIIRLCNGNNTIEEIIKKTKLSSLMVNEIIRKFKKKKLIEIKRIIV